MHLSVHDIINAGNHHYNLWNVTLTRLVHRLLNIDPGKLRGVNEGEDTDLEENHNFVTYLLQVKSQGEGAALSAYRIWGF